MGDSVLGWVPPLFVMLAAVSILAVAWLSRRGLILDSAARRDTSDAGNVLEVGAPVLQEFPESSRNSSKASNVIDKDLYSLNRYGRVLTSTSELFGVSSERGTPDLRGQATAAEIREMAEAMFGVAPLGSGKRREFGKR